VVGVFKSLRRHHFLWGHAYFTITLKARALVRIQLLDTTL